MRERLVLRIEVNVQKTGASRLWCVVVITRADHVISSETFTPRLSEALLACPTESRASAETCQIQQNSGQCNPSSADRRLCNPSKRLRIPFSYSRKPCARFDMFASCKVTV